MTTLDYVKAYFAIRAIEFGLALGLVIIGLILWLWFTHGKDPL